MFIDGFIVGKLIFWLALSYLGSFIHDRHSLLNYFRLYPISIIMIEWEFDLWIWFQCCLQSSIISIVRRLLDINAYSFSSNWLSVLNIGNPIIIPPFDLSFIGWFLIFYLLTFRHPNIIKFITITIRYHRDAIIDQQFLYWVGTLLYIWFVGYLILHFYSIQSSNLNKVTSVAIIFRDTYLIGGHHYHSTLFYCLEIVDVVIIYSLLNHHHSHCWVIIIREIDSAFPSSVNI